MRVMSGLHQTVRIDRVITHALSLAAEASIVSPIERSMGDADALVISACAKSLYTDGLVRAAFGGARTCGMPCLVDPNRASTDIDGGSIEPNRRKLTGVTQHPCDRLEQATIAAESADGQAGRAILPTRSETVVSFVKASCDPLNVAIPARDIVAISSIGDTRGRPSVRAPDYASECKRVNCF